MDTVHLLYPCHLIFGLELFADVFCLFHLIYQLRKQSVCLSVDIQKVSV